MKWISSLLVSLTALCLFGQSSSEALRYSTYFPGGTASTIGAGSSFGAMGGDFGILSINPAGLADYRSNVLMLSFGLNSGSTEALLEGGERIGTNHGTRFQLENIGAIFSYKPRSASVNTSNIAIGLVQSNNYYEEFGWQGMTTGSITERFSELANGRSPDNLDEFEAGLAYETGAIYDIGNDNNYETDFFPGTSVRKNQEVERSGKTNELHIAWASQFNSRVNFGVGIGVPFVSFEEDKVYEEEDEDDNIPFFDYLRYSERISTSATGFNVKLGLTYIMPKNIRVGLAFHTPTYFTFTDDYRTNLNYQFTDSNGSQSYSSASPDGFFKYRLQTPLKLTGSLGKVFFTETVRGFFNVDVDYLNYASSKFNFTAFSDNPGEQAFEREVNRDIDDQYQSTFNFRLGGEIGFSFIRLRGGIGLYGSPYFVDSKTDFSEVYSLGFGLRAESFFFDVAWQNRSTDEGYIPYKVLDESRMQLVTKSTDLTKIIFTLGYKF